MGPQIHALHLGWTAKHQVPVRALADGRRAGCACFLRRPGTQSPQHAPKAGAVIMRQFLGDWPRPCGGAWRSRRPRRNHRPHDPVAGDHGQGFARAGQAGERRGHGRRRSSSARAKAAKAAERAGSMIPPLPMGSSAIGAKTTGSSGSPTIARAGRPRKGMGQRSPTPPKSEVARGPLPSFGRPAKAQPGHKPAERESAAPAAAAKRTGPRASGEATSTTSMQNSNRRPCSRTRPILGSSPGPDCGGPEWIGPNARTTSGLAAARSTAYMSQHYAMTCRSWTCGDTPLERRSWQACSSCHVLPLLLRPNPVGARRSG